MALIQWNSSFSVNVKELDDQHQQLIKLLNELNDAMQVGKGKDVLDKIITGLIGYIRTHFATEERYFERFGYPDSQSHIAEHREFEEKVAEFKKRYDEGRLGLSIQLMKFLSSWVVDHIKNKDKGYAQFFNDKDLK